MNEFRFALRQILRRPGWAALAIPVLWVADETNEWVSDSSYPAVVDAASLVLAGAAIAFVALLAVLVPVRHASRIDPQQSLRAD